MTTRPLYSGGTAVDAVSALAAVDEEDGAAAEVDDASAASGVSEETAVSDGCAVAEIIAAAEVPSAPEESFTVSGVLSPSVFCVVSVFCTVSVFCVPPFSFREQPVHEISMAVMNRALSTVAAVFNRGLFKVFFECFCVFMLYFIYAPEFFVVDGVQALIIPGLPPVLFR